MSEAANVEKVREIHDRWGEGDSASGVEPCADDVELVQRPAFPDAGSHRGRDEVAAYTRELPAPWDRFAIESIIDEEDALSVAAGKEAGR